MARYTLKILTACLLLTLAGCRSSASEGPKTRPPLLTEEQSKEVLRILTMTDPLDKAILADSAGSSFVDLASEVEIEYMRCQQTLPQDNAARVEFRRIIDGYTIARTVITRKVSSARQNPVKLVTEANIRKTMLRLILSGRANEQEWQAFEAAHVATK